jgi:hypothetical protein
MTMSATRIQFDLSEDKLREVEEAMELAGITTKRQYLDYAFTVMKWALLQAQNGRTIAALDEKTGNYRELSMPPLDTVKRRARVSDQLGKA